MSIEALLFTALSGHSPLTALVGTRISPAKAIEAGDLPCVTFHQVTGNLNYTHQGPDNNVEDWWQFNAWSSAYDNMRAVSEAIADALHAGGTSPLLFHAFIDERIDMYETDTRTHHGIVMGRLWWLRS